MIKPDELESKAGQLTWDTIVAAAEGDVIALRQLLKQNPRLALSEYWYTPAIHFAVREGHIEAAELLLDAGAHPEWNGLHDGSLIQMASELGHAAGLGTSAWPQPDRLDPSRTRSGEISRVARTSRTRAGNPALQATKPISYMSLRLQMRQWRRPYIQ